MLAEFGRRLAEAHHVEHDFRRGIMLKVRDLLDIDLINPVRKRRHCQRQEIADPAWIYPRRVKGRLALPARRLQPPHDRGPVDLGVHVANRRDDVLARSKQFAKNINVGVRVVAINQRRQRRKGRERSCSGCLQRNFPTQRGNRASSSQLHVPT